MEQELNIAYDQKLTREVWQRVAQSLPPLEAPAADTGSCGIAAPPPEDSIHRLRRSGPLRPAFGPPDAAAPVG